MSLAWIVIDFNSFFASVEQQIQPLLRGRPVAVVPMMTDHTCVIAASYEAKKFGVKTGTMVGDARTMCPGLRLIEARHEIYVSIHHQLVAAVESCLHVDDVMSIDEMACELPAQFRTRDAAVALARKIKETIAARVGVCLHSSIGVAPNPFLAKVASDMQKPDGLTVIEKHELPGVLHTLELRDLCGIGRNMELRLRQWKILTVEQLCAAPKETLRAVWGGIEGERMFEWLRGSVMPRPPTNRSTVGHSHVLPPVERNEASAWAVLSRLLQKAAMRVRHFGYLAGGLALSLKYPQHGRWSDEIRFLETSDTVELLRAMQEVWARRPVLAPSPMAVGVVLFGLVQRDNATPPLFPSAKPRSELNRALDALNLRYGKNTVYFAGAHGALKSAPMRIAFSRIPDVQTEGDE